MENTIITQMLDDMLQKTIEKKIIWSVINVNAVRWIKPEKPHPILVTLQKQPQPNPAIRETYIFTIQQNQQNLNQVTSVVLAQINTAVDISAKDVLSKIFNEATKEARRIEDEKRAEVIKNLLNDIK
jgi:putative ubiquitin-RnfH superfamily antitoxin RatB of RatAB toxin-antitoxin module